jgi:hypothetical protein
MEKETLEEAAKSNALLELEKYQPTKERFKLSCKNSFLRGAKWQQEISYSEEEVIKLLHKRDEHMNTYDKLHGGFQTPKEWFEQFKKK